MIRRWLRSLSEPDSVGVTRRVDVARRFPRSRSRLETLLQRPEAWSGAGIALLFVALVTGLLSWAQRLPMLHAGQIARDTHVASVDFDVVDGQRTEENRQTARQHAAHVYRENAAATALLRDSLTGLPRAVAGKTDISNVIPELVSSFALTNELLHALAGYSDAHGEALESWTGAIDALFENGLYRRPIIDSQRFQAELTQPDAPIMLLLGDGRAIEVMRADLIDLKGPGFDRDIERLVSSAPADVRPALLARLRDNPSPTFMYDAAATSQRQELAAGTVPDEIVRHLRGEVLYRRGDRVTVDQVELAQAERLSFARDAAPAVIWSQRAGAFGLALLLTLLLGSYTWLYYTQLLRKPARLLGLAAFVAFVLAITIALTAAAPHLAVPIVLAPALLLAIVVGVAYDRRFAVGLVSLYALLACYALRLEIGYAALLVAAAGVNIWQLREVRDRNRLVRAGAITGLVAASAAFAPALAYRPFVSGWAQAALVDVFGSLAAGLGVGIFTLGILSSIERIFNVTTGLTLVELRDPRHPLLHELQRLAPGTWSHSLQVANIAEAAAESIGADGLLTYVGALYHDVGKMNKAAYFVENQVDGFNRHEKLSPAMSLLIIVGHVKDGLELAREFRLPRPLHHFIEAHHGTTLVEYFYNAARERAEAGAPGYDFVGESEYRYPGPLPRTREAAILMLADACESTSRTLDEPTPSRLEQLVRTLGERRLLDGQFDDCELTLRELRQIEDSILKSLCAIHHARIAYPGDEEDAAPPAADRPAQPPAVAAAGAQSQRTA